MTALIRSTAGTIELNSTRAARQNPTPDSDGVTRLRRGESVRIS